jgi:hypothetical protein
VTGVLLRKERIQNRLLVDLPVTAVAVEEKT